MKIFNKLKALIRGFMLHSKKSVTKRRGFSLIELLVVVAIIGILAAVAIPAYNQYRADAARGAFNATGSNFQRAFQACMANSVFANCNDLTKLKIPAGAFDGSTPVVPKAPLLCGNLVAEIGGTPFKGCYNSNGATGENTATFNQSVCYKDGGTKTVNGVGCNTSKNGAPCEELLSPITLCDADADCASAGTGDYCMSGQAGVCDADAKCT